MPRSSLMFTVPAAEPLVGALRAAHDPAAFAGVPAHITLLFPWKPPAQISDADLDAVSAHLAGIGTVELRFDRLARFPGLAYLALADPKPVIALIRGLAKAWPAYPPYEGKHPQIVPHLTVAHGSDDVLDTVEPHFAGVLPLVTTVDHVSLFTEDDTDHWHERTRFSLT